MILNKYIYDIRELLRNHHNVDEDELTDRQIEFWIVSQRAMWIKRRDDAYTFRNNTIRQTLVDNVISLDRSFEPDLVTAGYKILRNENTLPKPIGFTDWDGIISTGPIDMGSRRFNHTSYEEAVSSGNGRFNSNMIYTFYKDQYIYAISRSKDNFWYLISNIAVTGIFEDPRSVGSFQHITGEDCWSPDDDYPMSLDLWEFMKDEIKRGNINELVQIAVDKSNDGNFEQTEKA